MNKEAQYRQLYGEYVSGEYAIGDRITTRNIEGTVIWCYASGRGLVYILDTGDGWPEEIAASEIVQPK